MSDFMIPYSVYKKGLTERYADYKKEQMENQDESKKLTSQIRILQADFDNVYKKPMDQITKYEKLMKMSEDLIALHKRKEFVESNLKTLWTNLDLLTE